MTLIPSIRPGVSRSALLLLAAALPWCSEAESIAYNFSETSTNSTQELDTTTPKGPNGVSLWNDSYFVTSGDVASGTEDGLLDSGGGATDASITWSSKNTWYGDGGYSTQDQRIVLGYLDDGDTGNGNPGVFIKVTQIPYQKYNVYGILASDHGTNTTYTSKDFLVNGTTWVFGGAAASTATVYASMEATSANGAWVKIVPGTTTGNYWKLNNLTGSTLTIDGELGTNNVARGSISAIVIEDATDSDNDGMIDSWELNNNLIVGINDSAADPDGDGLSNLREFQLGTNPQLADTDGDGLSDGQEVQLGTNPKLTDTDGDGSDDFDDTAPLDPHVRPGTSTITWTQEGSVTTDADISTNGVFDRAVVFGMSDVSVTVGTETLLFTAADGGGNTGDYFTSAGGATGNASLDNLLNNHAAGTTQWRYTVEGLTPGATYQVQAIAGADRRAASSYRTQKFGDGVGHFSGSLLRSGPGYALGTFTASAAGSQVFDIAPGDTSGIDPAITALIFRKVSTSTLAISSFKLASGQFTLTWVSQSGSTYDVEYSDDLKTWTGKVNTTAIPATGTSTSYTFPKPANAKRFYRVTGN